MTINIQGEKWKITETNLRDMDGLADKSVREILIDVGLNNNTQYEGKIKNMPDYKSKVLRHELIHAFMFECGMHEQDEMHNERNVDWIAVMYPKLKEVFDKLGI